MNKRSAIGVAHTHTHTHTHTNTLLELQYEVARLMKQDT